MPASVSAFLVLFVFSVTSLFAQVSVKDSAVATPLIGLSYGFQLPYKDMETRFGYNSSIGCDLLYKTKKNWLFGIDGRFIFGKDVRENGILDSITTSANFLISTDGYPAVIKFFERGWSVMARFGKVFPVWPNENSGILVAGGFGLLQHKIRIEDISERAPQINSLYIRGYDRLSNGPCGMLSAGYFFLGNTRHVNFFAVGELYYAETKNRRGYNYDLMAIDTKVRKDVLAGFRIGVVIPFYKKVPNEYYYY